MSMTDYITKAELTNALEKVKSQYIIDIRDAVDNLISKSELRTQLKTLTDSIDSSIESSALSLTSRIDADGNNIAMLENKVRLNSGELSRSVLLLKNSITEAVASLTAQYKQAVASITLTSNDTSATAELEAKFDNALSKLVLRSEMNKSIAKMQTQVQQGLLTSSAYLELKSTLEDAMAVLNASYTDASGVTHSAVIRAFANGDYSEISFTADQIKLNGIADFISGTTNQTFTSQPTPPYLTGDIWTNATYGDTYTDDVLVCIKDRAEGESFSIGDWQLASTYVQQSDINSSLTPYNFLIETFAKQQHTYIQGGLILSSTIELGTGTDTARTTLAGMNGIYTSGATGGGIAAWYGGAMVDHQANSSATDYAKTAFRFDGSGYLASGNISWDSSGNVTLADSVKIGSSGWSIVTASSDGTVNSGFTLNADNIDFNATKNITLTAANKISFDAATIVFTTSDKTYTLNDLISITNGTAGFKNGTSGTLECANGSYLTWNGGVLTAVSGFSS